MTQTQKRRPGLPLRVHLVLFGLICFVPASIAVAVAGYNLARTEQGRVQDEAVRIASEFSRNVDAEIDGLTRALEALATSPALEAGDFRRFREQAVRVAQANEAHLALRWPDGRHVVNTIQPYDPATRAVTSDPVLMEADRRAIATRRAVLSNVYVGTAGRRHFVTVVLPIVKDDEVHYLLSIAITPQGLTEVLRLGPLAAQGWLSAVVGTDHRVIARTRELERFVGSRVTEDFSRTIAAAPTGLLRTVTLDRAVVQTAFTTGRHGLVTVVSVPEATLNEPVVRLRRLLLLLGLVVLVATLAGAWAYGRLLGDELATLAENARRMGEHMPLKPFGLKVAEVGAAQQAFAEVSEKADALMRELDHRVKNTLSVVQTLAGRTVGKQEERAALAGRIAALSRAHEALSASRWSDVSMTELLLSVCNSIDLKPSLSGPTIRLEPRTATALAQVFHELASNARRHGALATPGGTVAVTWEVRDGRLALAWQESGLTRGGSYGTGFGLKIVELCIVRQLNGTVDIAPGEAGWRVLITLPLVSELGVAATVAA